MDAPSPPTLAAAELGERLRRYFGRRLADRDAVDDLVQEVLLRIHEHADQRRGTGSVLAWVDRIARNVLVDHHRRRRPPESLADEPALPAEDDGNLNEVVAGWIEPMLARLPEDSREALRLAEIEGLPQAEVAARLGLGLSAAKSRIQRARAKLRDAILRCCHLELDRRGNVLGWSRRRCRHC